MVKYAYTKFSFPIRMIDSYGKDIEIVSGWRATEDLALYKSDNGKKWILTDLLTGTRMVARGTRDVCMDWYYEHEKEIAKVREQPWYTQRVMEFLNLLKEERAGINENN